MRLFRLAALFLLGGMGVVWSGCDPFRPEPSGRVYEVSVETGKGVERFRIRLEDPARIAEAESLLASGARRNVSGRLVRGDGGFNAPYGWHQDPATIEFPEVTIEVCDGSPSDIDEDLDYWVDTVQQYCPWGAWISRRISR